MVCGRDCRRLILADNVFTNRGAVFFFELPKLAKEGISAYYSTGTMAV